MAQKKNTQIHRTTTTTMFRGKCDWMSTVGAGVEPGIYQNREQAVVKARENEVKLR